MHAARQDLEVLWPLTGPLVKVFDTQVAAALAGWPAQIGYAELVRQVLGVTLAKAHTRTDWSRRPLSGAQIEYALDDVAHLAALRDALLERLSSLGRVSWLEQELRDLGREDQLFVDPERAWERLKGVAELDPWRRSLARAVAAWRERRASDRDRPRSWILPDTAVRGIVLRVPRSPADLVALEDVTPGFVENSGAEVLSLIEQLAPPSPLPPLPGRPRPDPELATVVKRLGEAVRTAANELHVSPELLATRRDLEAIARGRGDVAPLIGWRGE
ncbi:ribonuclease D, partial [bacterium]